MSTGGLAELRRLLVERYDTIKAQLTRRLGSAELAGDALHDAWLRLAAKDSLEEVRYPQAYLVNTAMHAAIDRMRGQAHELNEGEVQALFDLADPGAGPAAAAQARLELARVVDAMESLPPRQRDILFSMRVEGATREELARRYGISVRMVARELRTAHEYCARQMRR
ncbi:RNA polymerase sigma factor [Bordetella genomosp. 13]|uniref:RNA polymerase subunit sigma-24 n=1 Tax=Bordetella genomosp. 13 TaxID=463040 RepID=A0A1W6ZDB8_9BORD|nr:sigma-70 family RNA polymerase sigma factor [Bordetella genomosp. 13]ARP95376.1 RNA polymerase subunit sigma-24 [Bordetella genomosp. 13]